MYDSEVNSIIVPHILPTVCIMNKNKVGPLTKTSCSEAIEMHTRVTFYETAIGKSSARLYV